MVYGCGAEGVDEVGGGLDAEDVALLGVETHTPVRGPSL